MGQQPTDNSSAYVSGDLSYHLFVLGKMINVLPPELAKPMEEQRQNIVNALRSLLAELTQRDVAIKEMLEQMRLDTAYISFDLEATKRERDALLGGDRP